MNIPSIKIENNVLTISITLDELVHLVESKDSGLYKVNDKDKFFISFKESLENYQKSNSTELGITELQYLFDSIIDDVFVNSEFIEYKNDNPDEGFFRFW